MRAKEFRKSANERMYFYECMHVFDSQYIYAAKRLWPFCWVNRADPFTDVFSERELMFIFAIYVVVRPSVVCLSVCLSVTFVHPTQPIEIFGNVSAPFNTLVTW